MMKRLRALLLCCPDTPDMFGPEPPQYPKAPGFAKKCATSRAAAATVWKPTEMQKIVLEALKVRPMTDYEVCAHVGLTMNRIQPRRSELSAQGRVIDSAMTRETPYGKQAVVWMIAGRKNG